MNPAALEHVNVTVSDPDSAAKELCDLFGWHIRWAGDAIHGGRSVHVGANDSYVAVYSGTAPRVAAHRSYNQLGGLNHIGIVVDDLDAVEKRVKAAGYKPHAHADYDPGRRFYFDTSDGIEIEVVSYA